MALSVSGFIRPATSVMLSLIPRKNSSMPKTEPSAADWPPSIANWLAFRNGDAWLGTQEFPLFTDAWITGEIEVGPYQFVNTVAFKSGTARAAIVLRYAMHRSWQEPDFQKTNTDLYHGGSPPQELAALASLATGIRLRAGHSTRLFEPTGDPLGRPNEMHSRGAPYFEVPDSYILPAAVEPHSLDSLQILNRLPALIQADARALMRSARLYQDALWLAESAPELTWLLLVSALEAAANEWQKEKGDKIARLEHSKPELYRFLASLKDCSILPTVAEHIGDSLGITRKFVEFALKFLPGPPQLRPLEWAQFKWEPSQLKKALRTIYGYRSDALHDGRPFPGPMCEAPARLDASWVAPAERMLAEAASQRGGVWLQDDIPMNLHLFEYIARAVLLRWWEACSHKNHSS